MTEGAPARARLPLPLRPVPVFLLLQIGPLLLWAAISDETFAVVMHGFTRADLTVEGVMAYGLLAAGFVAGAVLIRPHLRERRADSPHMGISIRLLHIGAVLLAVGSALGVIRLVQASGMNPIAVILASQANLFKKAVYEDGGGALIMGRHLVLSALITWCTLATFERKRPMTLPIIVLTALVLYLFTSSRLTLIGILLIASLFWFRAAAVRDSSTSRRARDFVLPIALIALTGLAFVGGVWLRSVGSWGGDGGAGAFMLAPLYEAIAYFSSPVNYSVAFVNEGIAFQRGIALDHFFSAVYTVLNVTSDDYFRELIGWHYDPSLNQIGLVGEWYTIGGPLLWLPAMVYGALSAWAYDAFERGALPGLLLYPVIYLSLFDSLRGFLLPQNILAANVVYLGAGLLAMRVLPPLLAPTPVRGAAHG